MAIGHKTAPEHKESPAKATASVVAPETHLLVPIRVLYTLNSSSHFLLARQRHKVQVVPIPLDEICSEADPGPKHAIARFARVPLKICLGVVCSSSPELLADRSRDYSVYVLDPLESPSNEGKLAPSPESLLAGGPLSDNISPSCPPGEGLSIGMGLLSWCLSEDCAAALTSDDYDDNEGSVTGKLVKDRGVDALEVVMSLRETTPQTQQQHALSLSSLGFHLSTITSHADRPSPAAKESPSPMPTSSEPLELLQAPSTSSNTPKKDIPDSDGARASISRAASSSTLGHTPRVGRPPGATTHPEKRARRLAIQSHKEMLERMENIAKMQRGEKYDKTLIRVSDQNIPKVTDEEIARQRKLLEELESRPLIVDRSSRLLTTKPLPKRTKSSTSTISLAKNSPTMGKRRPSSPTNASPSGSGVGKHDVVSGDCVMNPSANNAVETKHGAELLLSLLTTVLGNVDKSSARHPVSYGSGKGKEKERLPLAEDALAGALKELLPLLPNSTSQAGVPSSEYTTKSMPSTAATLPRSSVHQRSISNGTQPQRAPSVPQTQRFFRTAEETFYNPQPGSNWPYDQHWAVAGTGPSSKVELPKVREDAHPVPGGGWARGRNLVPRIAATTDPARPPHPNWQTGHAVNDTAKLATTSTAQEQPDKENMPPKKLGRGLKRSLSVNGDAKENGEGISLKANGKKRKQEITPAFGNDEIRSVGSKRTVMGSAEKNKTRTCGASGSKVAASSPVRNTAPTRATGSLPVMAVSEPDYLSRPLPIVATSTSPDLMVGPPRTPPRRGTCLNDDADDSLFTPCAPESAAQFRGGVPPNDSLLFSPTPVRANSRGSHVAKILSSVTDPGGSTECSETGSESRLVRTGWDLPPSSPPPPTSPISPHAELGSGQEHHIVSELYAHAQGELDVEMEKGGIDGKFADHGTTIKCGGVSPHLAGGGLSLALQSTIPSSDFDPLTDAEFDFGEFSQVPGDDADEGNEGIELDIEELWSSLGPVIAQAQTESSIAADSQLSSLVEADFSYFDLGSDGQTHVEAEVQSGVDAIKLAEDLKALFGGCVV